MKRIFDLSVAVPLLLLSLPVQVAAGVAIRIRLGSPIFFYQERTGRYGTPFTIIKFRTMHPVDPAKGLIDDASRLDSLGQILRSTSIDELPTIWNIIRGDISIVGPRPLMHRYIDRYSPRQARRHQVPPGLTGLAQVNGRNSQSWEERFEYDVEYIENRSFRMDLKIMALTVIKVLAREGVNASNHATMTEFLGTSVSSKQKKSNPLC